MHEICGAVNGVHDERWGDCELGFTRLVGFFADELVGWVGGLEACGDHFFNGLVGFCYEVRGWERRGWSIVVQREREQGGGTVLFGAGVEVGGCCGHYHAACFLGDVDQEIMDLLERDICHLVCRLRR